MSGAWGVSCCIGVSVVCNVLLSVLSVLVASLGGAAAVSGMCSALISTLSACEAAIAGELEASRCARAAGVRAVVSCNSL